MSKVSNALEELAKAEEALSDALDALGRASADHGRAAALAEAAGARVAHLAGEAKRLDRATQALEKRLGQLREALKKAQEGAETALASLMKLGADGGDRGGAEKGLRDTIDTRERAAVDLAGYEAKLADLRKRREDLAGTLAGASRDEERANGEAEAAAAAKANAEAEAGEARDALVAARETLARELELPKPNGVDHPFVKLLAEQEAGKAQDFLSIRRRSVNYDEWVREALRTFGADLGKQIDRAELRDALLAAGVATNIGEVTKILNRRRIADIRRELLAQAYPALLAKRLGAADGEARGPLSETRVQGDLASAIAANRRRARDVRGLADLIALDLDSQAKEGVRMTFAGILAGIVVKRMGLDERTAPRAVIQAHICDSI